MRGSQMARLADARERIIPAHAGLTTRSPTCLASSRDHPRACGAHNLKSLDNTIEMGSSPRMRGSHCRRFLGNRLMGIIPAHAGLTHGVQLIGIGVRDHPRACGAHLVFIASLLSSMGSSPRMRGSLIRHVIDELLVGIIPAHAGLTNERYGKRYAARDHPRACGAHSIAHA